MRVTGFVILVILVAVALTLLVARVRWRFVTNDLIAQLSDSSMEMVSAAILPAEIDSLPAPVARYLGAVLGPEPRQVASVRVLWTGEFAQRPGVDEWRPLTAEQVFHTRPPGFVWNARISLGPGLDVLVRDAFVDGGGSMRGAIHGLVPVVDVHGTPEISASALQRYLGEAVWFPAALLPRNGVCWEPLSDSSARASLTVGETSVTCDFRFGADGLVESVYVLSRFRDVDGTPVPTPWEALVSEYEERDGVLVPSSGEAAWLLPDGRFPYWRGEVASLEYSYGDE
jgi:hypothetical protein